MSAVLPPTLFTGQAPRLVDVALSRVELVDAPDYPAFAAVTSLSLGLRSTQPVFPTTAISRAFPVLSSVSVHAHESGLSTSPTEAALLKRLHRLDLSCCDRPAVHRFLDWIDARSLNEVWLACPEQAAMERLIGHLKPPLHMCISEQPMFRSSNVAASEEAVALHSLVDGKIRGFAPATCTCGIDFMEPFVPALQGLRCIQELTLATGGLRGLAMLEHLGAFPALTILRVRILPDFASRENDPSDEEDEQSDTFSTSTHYFHLSIRSADLQLCLAPSLKSLFFLYPRQRCRTLLVQGFCCLRAPLALATVT